MAACAIDIVLLLPKIVLTALLVLAIADMLVGVFLRYVMVEITDWLDLDPVNFFWVEEVGEFSLAWLTMIGAGDRHCRARPFHIACADPSLAAAGAARRSMSSTHLLIAGFGGLAAWYGIEARDRQQRADLAGIADQPRLALCRVSVGGALIVLYGLASGVEPAARPPDADEDAAAIAAGDD